MRVTVFYLVVREDVPEPQRREILAKAVSVDSSVLDVLKVEKKGARMGALTIEEDLWHIATALSDVPMPEADTGALRSIIESLYDVEVPTREEGE